MKLEQALKASEATAERRSKEQSTSNSDARLKKWMPMIIYRTSYMLYKINLH